MAARPIVINAVVVYPVDDPRGVSAFALTAEDSTGGRSARAVQGLMDSRRSHYLDTQDPLVYMARGTGGFFVRNTNDLSKGLGSVPDDRKGYYLIGFRPGQGFFEPDAARRAAKPCDGRPWANYLVARDGSGS